MTMNRLGDLVEAIIEVYNFFFYTYLRVLLVFVQNFKVRSATTFDLIIFPFLYQSLVSSLRDFKLLFFTQNRGSPADEAVYDRALLP